MVGVNMVVIGCSSQQKQRKRRKVISVMKMYFEERVKQRNQGKKKQLENNQRVKERNVKTAIFQT